MPRGGKGPAGGTEPPERPLTDIGAQARAFRHVREARRLELSEDYAELIDDLIRDGGEARQVDIAARLGVSQPTVARMLGRMIEEELVERRPYRGVFLTDSGRALAQASRARHRIVEQFLIDLGASPETARHDAEGIEHHASAETLALFRAFSAVKSRRDR